MPCLNQFLLLLLMLLLRLILLHLGLAGP